MLEGFLILGVVVLISVIGNRLYEKTGVPESLFMIILGMVAGPLTMLVPPSSLSGIVNYIFTLSLIVIVLESGISTEISEALDSMKHASLFTFIILLTSISICSTILYFVFNWNLISSMVMGIICSGTSTLPVVYMTQRLELVDKVENLLVFESIFNDITLLTSLTLAMKAFSMNNYILDTIVSLVKHVTEPIIYGSFSAILWIFLLLGYLKRTHVKYISTLAVVSILYAVTEVEKGSGILAILVFSILLGNLHQIANATGIFSQKIMTHLNQLEVELEKIRGIQTEMSFLAKNIFFFIMGILFDIRKVDANLLKITATLIVIIFISRYLTARFLSRFESSYMKNILVIALMLPRGLTASIASYLPTGSQIVFPQVVEITLLMVIITNIATIGGFTLINHNDRPDSEPLIDRLSVEDDVIT